MPIGRPCQLTAEMVDIARRISEQGGAVATVARACGVTPKTAENWMRQAREGTGSELQVAFLRAIQAGQHEAEINAILKIVESRDPRDAQWWLTHHPTTRDTWSDAAADRRAERRTVTAVLEAIAAAELPADVEQVLLLQMQARGLGTQPPDEA